MKNLIISFLLFVPFFGQSQTFDVSTNLLELNYKVTDFASDYIFVDNNSGSDLDLKFDLISNTVEPIGWIATLCTHVLCYPNIPLTEEFDVLKDGEQGSFNTHIGFNGISGTGEIKLKIYEKSNPFNADTITFLYHAGSLTGVDIASNERDMELFVYPNPSVDYISVSGIEDYQNVSVRIFDMKGVVVLIDVLAEQQIDVIQLEKGIYALEIVSNGERVKTLFFVKK